MRRAVSGPLTSGVSSFWHQISAGGLHMTHKTLRVTLCAAGLAATAVNADENPATAVALEEVTVTATRQVETVNTIPLSIQAVTQDSLDRQGIKSTADLVRAVPGLAVVATQGAANQQTFSIRGIVGGTGAA